MIFDEWKLGAMQRVELIIRLDGFCIATNIIRATINLLYY